ncbi:MAG TPA: flagellin [Acetobacteraceae bacterium]|nr:flagellin [Acetobacteraceae bacterium]
MSLGSVNTNVGAMIALQSLNMTETQLQAVQKQISTGYRVADATDDGAAYAVAQRVRSSVGALTSANQQLGNVQGLVSVTLSSLNDVSNELNSMNALLVKLADGNTQGNQRTQYLAQYQQMLQQVKTYFNGSAYNGKSLIANVGGAVAGVTFGATTVVQDELGTTYGIATYGGNTLYSSINTADTTSTAFQSFLNGTFANALNNIANKLNYYGSVNNYLTNQISYNSDKIDALNTGLGALVDANLAQESAQLQALQIRQQLGTQSLSMANQAPATLLSLFK